MASIARLIVDQMRQLAKGDVECQSEAIDRVSVRRILRRVTTRISSKGQIVLPVEIRERDRIEAGQEFEIERVEAGEYRLTRKSRPTNEGLVDLLLACPVKGWFKPLARTETTDDIATPPLG